MPFVSEVKIAPSDQPSTLWLSFVGDKLICIPDGPDRYRPYVSKIAADPTSPPIALGTMDGLAVYTATFDDSLELPATTQLIGLRVLHPRCDPEWFSAAALSTQLAHFAASYKHCPSCTTLLVPSRENRSRECEMCARHWFPRVMPCVIVLVHDGDKLLMTRQSRFPPGMYGLVAGFVEAYESLETCIDREVFEECGVAVKDVRYFSSQPWPFPEQLMVGYFAQYAGGELTVDYEELEEARWFSVHELPKLPPKMSIARALIDAFVEQRRHA